MQLHVSFDLYKVATGYFVVSSILMLAILYFMAPSTVGGSGVSFTNLVLASSLMILSMADTMVIPKPYRAGLRSLATMLMFANIDLTICEAHSFVKSGTFMPDEKARGAMRFSTIVIIINSIGVFLVTYFRKITQDMLGSLTSASVSIIFQRLFRFITVLLLVFAQILAWSMTDMCQPPSRTLVFPGFTTIGYAVLLTVGSIYDDREAFDYALIAITNYVFTAQVVFDSSISDPNQDAFQGLWQANVWLRFVAGIFVGFSVLAEILGNNGINFTPTSILSWRGATQITCLVFGLTGAICIYAKGPSDIVGEQTNWNFSFAWFVPLLQVLFLLTNLDYLRGVVFILAFPILGAVGSAVLSSLTYGEYGYMNAGMVMCFFAVFVSVIMDIVLERPFGLRPIDEYFSDEFPTAAGGTKTLSSANAGEVSRKFFTFSAIVAYLAASDFAAPGSAYAQYLLVAFYMFLGNECKMPDLHRILFFQAIPSLFTTSLWPLYTQTSAFSFLLFFILSWFAFHYIYRYHDASLQMVTGEKVYESEAPFLAAKGAQNQSSNGGYGSVSGYQRVPSDGPSERTSLTKEQSDQSRSSYHGAAAAAENERYQSASVEEEHNSGKFEA